MFHGIKVLIAMMIGVSFYSAPLGALEVSNESEHGIGVIVFQIREDRDAPLYLKVVEPGARMIYETTERGPYAVSLINVATKQELRLADLGAGALLAYDGEELNERPEAS